MSRGEAPACSLGGVHYCNSYYYATRFRGCLKGQSHLLAGSVNLLLSFFAPTWRSFKAAGVIIQDRDGRNVIG